METLHAVFSLNLNKSSASARIFQVFFPNFNDSLHENGVLVPVTKI